MAVVKITDKETIEKLQAKITLRLGRKISQQETLDLCINFAEDHLDELMLRINNLPRIDSEKASAIKKKFNKYRGTPYDVNAKFDSACDNDAYSV